MKHQQSNTCTYCMYHLISNNATIITYTSMTNEENTPFVLHLYSMGIWATIIQAVVDGDLCCIVHCSVTTLSTIDGQWDNENTFIKIVIQVNYLNSIQFTSNYSLFHFRSPITCLCSTHTNTGVQCGVYQYTGVQCGV